MTITSFLSKASCLLVTFLLISCTHLKPSVTQNWPMFGGPNGNNQLVTMGDVPTQWSVRHNKNIKWRLPLPAGGQSGISVWDDKLFLTINLPADTEPYELLEQQYNTAKTTYQNYRQQTISGLKGKYTERYRQLLEDIQLAESEREKFALERSEQKLRQLNRWEKMKHPIYQAVVNREKNAREFLFSKTPLLLKYYQEQESTYKKVTSSLRGKDVLLYCVNRYSGELLWQRKIEGVTPAMYNYTFSDATSPTPATNGKYVWVINASGGEVA